VMVVTPDTAHSPSATRSWVYPLRCRSRTSSTPTQIFHDLGRASR
jgi:hypothetical protein